MVVQFEIIGSSLFPRWSTKMYDDHYEKGEINVVRSKNFSGEPKFLRSKWPYKAITGNIAFAMSHLFTNYEDKLRGKYISSHRIPFIFLIENLSVIVQRSQVTLIQCMLPQIQQFPHKHEVTCMSPNMINKSF